MDLLSGLTNASLTRTDSKKTTKTKTGGKSTSRAYRESYTAISNIPAKYCRTINSKKQCEAIRYNINSALNMSTICYVLKTYKKLYDLIHSVTFEALHISRTGVYIDYTCGVGIHLTPVSDTIKRIRIFDTNEEVVLDKRYDERLDEYLEANEF